MSPPPRRNSGKGRGRGGRGGERRPSGDRSSVSNNADKPPKKRERGSSGSKREGRGGGGPSASSSAATSARPTRAVTTVLKKLVVRNIPSTATEQEARELLQAHGVGGAFVWRFVPGRQRSNNRAPTPARLYLDMKKEPEKARKLIASLHGQMFYPDTKGWSSRGLEEEGEGGRLTTCICIGRQWRRQAARCGVRPVPEGPAREAAQGRQGGHHRPRPGVRGLPGGAGQAQRRKWGCIRFSQETS
jgi:hypothetical protein